MRACVRACVRVCVLCTCERVWGVRACVRACVHACMSVCLSVSVLTETFECIHLREECDDEVEMRNEGV